MSTTNESCPLVDTLKYERRIDDIRINRIEDTVNGINAKINNGLSERSIKTAEEIEKIDNILEEHIIDLHDLRNNISNIESLLNKLSTTQGKWINIFYKGLIILLFSIISFIGTLIYNIDEIDHDIDTVKVLLNSGDTLVNSAVISNNPKP